MKKRFIFIVSAMIGIVALLSGCHEIYDQFMNYNGPTTIASDAKSIVYTPKEEEKGLELHISDIYQEVYSEDSGKFESITISSDSDVFQGDFFTVTEDGANFILKIDENITEYKRIVSINYSCSSNKNVYCPTFVEITQLPYGQTTDE